MADENMERAANEAREALAAIRERLQNGVNWMMHGRNTGKGIGVADMRALIEFIDARLEAEPDDDEFNLFVARAACGHLGARCDDLDGVLRGLVAALREHGTFPPKVLPALHAAEGALGVDLPDGGQQHA